MAQTKRKRRTKHRGNAAGMVEARGRTGRRLSPEEQRELAAIWERVPGRWVLGTGDYNLDARADALHRLPGGPRRALGPTAVSSYMKLGTRLAPTFPGNDRHIDYVWADRQAYSEGRIRFARQWVLGGLNSDHNALIARLVLT